MEEERDGSLVHRAAGLSVGRSVGDADSVERVSGRTDGRGNGRRQTVGDLSTDRNSRPKARVNRLLTSLLAVLDVLFQSLVCRTAIANAVRLLGMLLNVRHGGDSVRFL